MSQTLPSSSSQPARKKVTVATLRAMRRRGEPIVVLTAHDFPSAHVADAAGVDLVLVGDSLAMVALGMEDTSEVTVDEMLVHCRSVARATRSALTVSWSLFSFPCLIFILLFQEESVKYKRKKNQERKGEFTKPPLT